MDLHLERLDPAVRRRAGEFLVELVEICGAKLHSLYVVGSAATEDWREGVSDVNSLVVLHETDLAVIERVAPIGGRHGRRGAAAPLFMDPHYIRRSLDVFPMEFCELRLIHVTLAGEDLLAGLEVALPDLRRQCEREVKARLLGLRQGYLTTRGEPGPLRERLTGLIPGLIPLLRGVIVLLGKDPPRTRQAAIDGASAATGIELGCFRQLLHLRGGGARAGREELRVIFEACYRTTERLGNFLDEISL